MPNEAARGRADSSNLDLPRSIFVLLFVLLAITACSASTVQPAPATTVDTDEIAKTVLAQVESQLAQQTDKVPVVYDGPAATVAVNDLQARLISLYQQANPSVVYIVVPPAASGSGFVYGKDGYHWPSSSNLKRSQGPDRHWLPKARRWFLRT